MYVYIYIYIYVYMYMCVYTYIQCPEIYESYRCKIFKKLRKMF